MKTTYSILSIIIFSLVSFSCHAAYDFVPISKKIEMFDKEKGLRLYVDNMKEIIAWRKDNEKEHYLPGSSVFDNIMIIDMYKNSYRHYKRTIDILNTKGISKEVKFMAINLSQCLSIDDYISLGRVIYSSVSSKNSEVSILGYYISPGMEWGTIFSDNYKNEKIRKFLNEILQDKEYGPSLEILINNNILSGAFLLSYIKSHRQYGAFPTINCK